MRSQESAGRRFQLPTSDFRLPTSDFRLPTSDLPTNIHANDAIHEIQFGHIRRLTHGSRPFDADRFEVCAHKWSALTEEKRGAAVLNDSKYGISVRGGTLSHLPVAAAGIQLKFYPFEIKTIIVQQGATAL